MRTIRAAQALPVYSARLSRPTPDRRTSARGLQAPDLVVCSLEAQIGCARVLRLRLLGPAKALQNEPKTVVPDSAVGLQLDGSNQIAKRQVVLPLHEMNYSAGILTVNRVRVLGHAFFGHLDGLIRPLSVHVFP